MDDLTRSSRLPQPEPAACLILSLQREPGDNPNGLEAEIAVLIRSACTREGRLAEPDVDTWELADNDNSSLETVAVDLRLVHAIDEVAAENQRRVKERGQMSASPLSTTQTATDRADAVGADSSRRRDLEEQIRCAVQRCQRHNIHLSVEALEAGCLATPQHSHKRGEDA